MKEMRLGISRKKTKGVRRNEEDEDKQSGANKTPEGVLDAQSGDTD